jgi:hypothetical protein
VDNRKKTPEETLKELQEIAALSAKTLERKIFERLTTNEVLLVDKLVRGEFLKVKVTRDGKVGEATSTD